MDGLPSASPSAPVTDMTSSTAKLQRACERCWKRKQKCDRLVPTCSGCAENNAPCRVRVVTVDVEALPKDTTRPISHLSSYVESLKRKTEDLRGTLQHKRVKIDHSRDTSLSSPSSQGNVSALPGVGELSPSADSTATTANPAISYGDEVDDGSVHAAMGEIGYLSLSAMAEPRDSSSNLSRPISLQTMLKAATSIQGSEPYRSALPISGANARKGTIDLVGTSVLSITRETTLEFVHNYINQLSFRFPALNHNKILEYYDLVFPEDGDTHVVGSVSDLKAFITYNIIAVGILLSQEANTLKALATKLHSSTLDLFPRLLGHDDPVVALQFQLLLIVYSMYSASGGSTWHLTGLAARKCIALGYHREPEPREQLSEEKTNSRRWLFWTIYIIDRTISSIMDRPFVIQDEEITLNLPGRSASLNIVRDHILSHARLTSSILFPSSPGFLFDWYNLSSWRGSIPVSRPMLDSSQYPVFHFQQLSCRTITQLVGSRWLRSESRGINGKKMETEIQSSCIRFIRNWHDRLEEDNLVGSFVDAYDVFSIGVTYLAVLCKLKSQQSIAESTEAISKCSTLLTILTENFKPLSVFRKLLWALHGVVIDICGPQTFLSNVPPALKELPSFIPNRLSELIKAVIVSESLT